MSNISAKTQKIIERMVCDKFAKKGNALEMKLVELKERNRKVANEEKDKCREAILRAVCKANDDVVKLLKNAGFKIKSNNYHGSHLMSMLESDGSLRYNWRDDLDPIANDKYLQSLEEELEKHYDKRNKAMDEIILRISLGCKCDEVIEYINSLEV